MRTSFCWLAFVWVLYPAVSFGQVPLQGKQVAAGPEDIISGRVRMPDRRDHAETIRGSLVQVEAAGKLRQASLWVPAGEVSLIPIWAEQPEETMQLRLGDSAWQSFPALQARGLTRVDEMAPVDSWSAMSPARLTVRMPQAGFLGVRLRKPGYVLVGDSVPETLHHGLSSYHVVQGEDLALLAWLEGMGANVLSAQVQLEAGARSCVLTMQDTGRQLDGLAGDGTFGARLPKDWIGHTTAWTRVQALSATGERFTRVGMQQFEVLPPCVRFSGEVSTSLEPTGLWNLDLAAWVADPELDRHLAAEVWATAPDGRLQPACWLARALETVEEPGLVSLRLALDPRWLVDAGLSEPLELRNVRIQNRNGWAVLDSAEALPVPVLGASVAQSAAALADSDQSFLVTNATFLPPLSGLVPDATDQALFGLMLVHGWCSGGGVWPTAQFDGPKLVFNDPNQNRTHDEFAQLLGALGSQKRSFGGIGHSQGGVALLHLATYYTTGLDHASGGRVIQSLASPYQGTPLASLGFFLCGVNQDLTTSGSAAWLANIPTVARDLVSYYSTSNSGSACQFATDFFLSNPEDGVVEQSRAQLPGAHNMGHITGWCHTTGMSNPAGYNDATRNAVMNAAAAR